jgi:hypothetical protein
MRSACTILALVVIGCLLPQLADAERTVVLITSENCPVQEISALDIRKAYLSVAVNIDGHMIRPFRMRGDDMLSQIFYQSIVAMSQKSYERRALSMALKFGTPRPVVFDDIETADDAVLQLECSVLYLWKEDADSLDGIRIIKLLWQGD